MELRPLGWAAHIVREEGFWDWARRIEDAASLIDERDCAESCFALLNSMRGYQDALCDAGGRLSVNEAYWAMLALASTRKCIETLSQARWEHDDEIERETGSAGCGKLRPAAIPAGDVQQGTDFASAGSQSTGVAE